MVGVEAKMSADTKSNKNGRTKIMADSNIKIVAETDTKTDNFGSPMNTLYLPCFPLKAFYQLHLKN